MFAFLIFYLGKGVKVLRLQALPTQNLPQKSHEVAAKPERRHLQIVKEIPLPNSNTQRTKNVYTSLRDMENKISKQKLSGFQLQSTERKMILRKMMFPYTIPYFEIIIDESLEFACYILGWKVPDVHTLYRTFIRSARKSTITEVIALLSSFKLCIGLSSATDDSFHHVAPCEYSEENDEPCTSKVSIRPKTRELLINGNSDNSTCRSCVEFPAKAKKEADLKQKNLSTPALLNAPLRYTNPEKVTLAVQRERAERKKLECENKLLQAEIDRMRNEIKTSGIKVDAEFESDIQYIMKNNIDNASPSMKMFWKEQKKAFEDNKNVSKYHPMIIRFCLLLAAKSPSAYEEVRDLKILQLPSKRTLRDYRNAVKPTAEFNKDVINELTIAASKLSGHQRYLTVAFDEMKIKESLVFNKNSNELVGYVNIGDPELNYGTFEDTNQLATHGFKIQLGMLCYKWYVLIPNYVNILGSGWHTGAYKQLACHCSSF